jgi:hypothetical protein
LQLVDILSFLFLIPLFLSGPLKYAINAHFTNAVGGLDAEFSYDEIGNLQVL